MVRFFFFAIFQSLHDHQWSLDWGTIFSWHRGWFGRMHCTLIYPRIISYPAARKDGCFKVCNPHPSLSGYRAFPDCFISVVMITLGQVIAYGIGAGFFHLHGGWRWMVGLGAVPAGIQTILLFFLPESRE